MGTNMINDKTFLDLDLLEAPKGADRRKFLMRSATIGAAAVLTGCSAEEKAKQVGGAAPPPDSTAPPREAASNLSPDLSPDLDVVKKSKGPIITTIDEF